MTEVPQPSEGQPSEEQEQQVPLHVLAVDDDIRLVQMLGTMVGSATATFDTLENPEDALAKFEDQKKRAEEGRAADGVNYNVLLTDWNMPEMKGTELAAQAKALVPDLIIGMITGGDSGEALPSAETLEASGITFTMLKPFRLVDARKLISDIQTLQTDQTSQP